MTESPETEAGDCLLGDVNVVLFDPLYNVWDKAGEANYKPELFTKEDISDLVKVCLESIAPGPTGAYFVPASVSWRLSKAAGLKCRNFNTTSRCKVWRMLFRSHFSC